MNLTDFMIVPPVLFPIEKAFPIIKTLLSEFKFSFWEGEGSRLSLAKTFS